MSDISINSTRNNTGNNRQSQYNVPVIAATTVAGSAAGGAYAFRHPSDATVKKLETLKPTPAEWFQSLLKSFNMKKAQEALKNNTITEQAYNTTKGVVDSLKNVLEKEEIVEKVRETPHSQRKISLSQATKEANQTRPAMYKSMKNFTEDLMSHLNEHGIFNKNIWEEAKSAAKEKGKQVLKIMAKPLGIGAAVGAGVGLLIGLGVNSLLKSSKKAD